MPIPKAALLLAGLALFGCGERELKDDVTAAEAFPIQFSAIRDRILVPRCGTCHNFVVSRKLLLERWVEPGSASHSGLYLEVESGSMPPYGEKLMDEEIAAIKQWIDAGATLD